MGSCFLRPGLLINASSFKGLQTLFEQRVGGQGLRGEQFPELHRFILLLRQSFFLLVPKLFGIPLRLFQQATRLFIEVAPLQLLNQLRTSRYAFVIFL